MSSDPNTRPSERFAGDTGTLDLEREATDLLEHAVGSEHGHAQRTLYRHGGVPRMARISWPLNRKPDVEPAECSRRPRKTGLGRGEDRRAGQ